MAMESLILQFKLFMHEDMDIEVTSVTEDNASKPNFFELKEYTSMIGTGGTLNSMIVISYESNLLDKLVHVFMEGEEVEPEEAEEVKESVSGEVLNTIMGLALPTFPNRGKGVTMTPPISISDANNIHKNKSALIKVARFTTEFGGFMICIISSDSLK